ncbi:hypothetical protein VM98_38030, partial [Streptomyces rubellomurinus subsp. indigoferus]
MRGRGGVEMVGRGAGVGREGVGVALGGERRQGGGDVAGGGAVGQAAGVAVGAVRRALMFRGSARAVAEAALAGGEPALAAFRLEVGRPVRPMLAASA